MFPEEPASFPPKLQSEEPITSMDFKLRIPNGVRIVSCAVAIVTFAGTDPSPGSVLLGSATFLGTIVSQQVQAGVQGVVYMLTYTVTLSDGEVLQEQRLLQIAVYI